MPTSAKQLAANRANARKSTGPRTPAGKQRSSQNAKKHGLYSKFVQLPDSFTNEAIRLAHLVTQEFDHPELKALAARRALLRVQHMYYASLVNRFYQGFITAPNPLAYQRQSGPLLRALARYQGQIYHQARQCDRTFLHITKLISARTKPFGPNPSPKPKTRAAAAGAIFCANEPISTPTLPHFPPHAHPALTNLENKVLQLQPLPLQSITAISAPPARPVSSLALDPLQHVEQISPSNDDPERRKPAPGG